MASLPDAKIDKLRLLLTSLKGDRAARLCQMASQGDPGLGRVLEFCSSEPADAIRARFFLPLKAVSGEPGVDPPSRSYAPAKLLKSLWSWLEDDLDPEIPGAVRAVVMQNLSAAPDGSLDALRRRAADAIEAGVKAAKDDPRALKRLKVRLDVSHFEDVHHAVSLLRSAPVLRKAVAGLPAEIVEMTDSLAAQIRDRYEAAAEADPDAGVWTLFLIMSRFQHPWRLLRVFERIARRGDDLLVSQTDMAHIGEALLADAEFHLERFEAPPAAREAAVDAAEALAAFSAITVGMTREIGIRKDGPWGKRVYALRARASEQMSAIHDIARDVVARAAPEGGSTQRRAGRRDGEDLAERAEALCLFLYLSRDDAGRAAVGSAHAAVMKDIGDRLEDAGQRLLESLRSGASGGREEVQSRAVQIAALMRAAGESEAAGVLLRRTAAACAA
ncbi:MAG: hypothetical protein RIA71_15210 [Oceanicaulis sp.]